jgi:secondary thiamine-phosphate synthase enzyme
LVDITARVQAAVKESGVRSGICVVYVPHTTAGVIINEGYDPDVASDITATLSKLVPAGDRYAHSEGNADAHVKASLVGTSQTIPVEDGRPALGRWQAIFLCEFDGPRERRCTVSVLPGPQPKVGKHGP